MQIIYPYQVRLLIQSLTTLAESFDRADDAAWHPLASAAACLERLLSGEAPTDIADIVARLQALGVKNPGARQCGRTVYVAISMAIAILDGHRLGLLVIQIEAQRPLHQPVWIGIDMGTGDRTVFGGTRHA